jgi:ABC-type branched-subunit amino acid transport system substrate-binding protein
VGTALALASVLAACGDDSGGESSSPATDEADLPSGEPIKIMQIHELSAGIATKTASHGAIAAVDRINADGGIKGRPVEYIECDTEDDPNTTTDCARSAVDEGVVAVVGSVTVQDYYPVLEENSIASYGPIPANTGDFTSPNSFPIVGGAPVAFALLAAGLAEDGAENIAVVRPDLAAGAAIPTFANNGLERFGLETTNDVPVPTGAPDMASYVEAAVSGGTDAVMVVLTGSDALNFVQTLRQSEPDIAVAIAATDFTALAEALGDDINGILTFSYLYDASFDLDASRQYLEDLENAGFEEDLNSEDVYAAVLTFAEIAKMLPKIDAASFFEILPTIQGLPNPLGPDIQFVEGGVAGLPRVFSSCGLLYKFEDQEPVALSDEFVDAFTGEPCS